MVNDNCSLFYDLLCSDITEMIDWTEKKLIISLPIYTHTHNLWPPESAISDSSCFAQRMLFFLMFCYSCSFFFRLKRIAYYLLQTLLSMTYVGFCLIGLMSFSSTVVGIIANTLLKPCTHRIHTVAVHLFGHYQNTCTCPLTYLLLNLIKSTSIY